MKKVRFNVDQRVDLLADIFEGQWTPAVENIIKENNGFMVPIPNNMTSYFQPLHITVNRACKAFLRNNAQGWYSDQVQEQLSRGISPDKASIDARLNVLKPVHAKWIAQFYDYMQTHEEIILKSWERARVTKTLKILSSKADKNKNNLCAPY